MDAASLAEFDALANATGEALWGGLLTLHGEAGSEPVEVPATVTLGSAMVEAAGSQGGGMVRVQILSATIRKSELEAEPVFNSLVTHVVGTKRQRYRIDQVSGQGASESAWFIRAVQSDR